MGITHSLRRFTTEIDGTQTEKLIRMAVTSSVRIDQLACRRRQVKDASFLHIPLDTAMVLAWLNSSYDIPHLFFSTCSVLLTQCVVANRTCNLLDNIDAQIRVYSSFSERALSRIQDDINPEDLIREFSHISNNDLVRLSYPPHFYFKHPRPQQIQDEMNKILVSLNKK